MNPGTHYDTPARALVSLKTYPKGRSNLLKVPDMRLRRTLLQTLLAVTVSSPLDLIARLVGTPGLHDAASVTNRPIDEAEHVECHLGLAWKNTDGNACAPSAGCHMRDGQCVPRIGHYWATPANDATVASSFFLLPPAPPPFYMMTEKGVVVAESSFFFTHYRLVDAQSAYEIPGLDVGVRTACYVALPGFVTFLSAMGLCRGKRRSTRTQPAFMISPRVTSYLLLAASVAYWTEREVHRRGGM